MTILFVNNPGGLFNRVGAMGEVLADQQTFQGTTLPTDTQGIIAQFPTNNDLVNIDGIETQLSSAQQNAGTLAQSVSTYAANTCNYMVLQDNPLLTATNTTASLKQIISQMIANSVTVQRCTVASTVTAASGNQGNGVCVASVLRSDALPQENSFGETITVACSNDSTTSASLAGREQFTINGQVNYPQLDWRYVGGGSGATSSCQAIDAEMSNSGGNLLTNSDFETFVSNVPTGWSIITGTAGTTIKSSATAYTGSSSLEFLGNGSELTSIAQTFSVGTAATLASQTQYACALWVQVSAVPAAGVLQVALVDGTNTIINDQQGNANSFTIALTGATTSWVAHSGVFRTPYVLPSTIKLRVSLSTALSSGKDVFIDHLSLGTMTQVYQGGPSVAVFSGSSNFYVSDSFGVAVTNNQGGASLGKTFQRVFDRFFNMKSLNLMLPSSGSPTVSDSLIAS